MTSAGVLAGLFWSLIGSLCIGAIIAALIMTIRHGRDAERSGGAHVQFGKSWSVSFERSYELRSPWRRASGASPPNDPPPPS